MNQVQYILCDVEGTTTDIRFVHNELFPFARAKIGSFFADHPEEQAQSALVLNCAPQDVVAQLKALIDADVKDAELKRIQGKIWAVGYASGDLKGHVYDDVPAAFSRWVAQGKTLGIYSSGSVQAQKLIYGNSIAGDMCVYLSHHFDLKQGYKYEAKSYQNIVSEIEMEPSRILFLSDVEAELDAAKRVGLHTIRLFRDNIEETKHDWKIDFREIFPA